LIPSEDWYDLYDDNDYDIAILDEFHGQKTLQFLHSWLQPIPFSLKRRGTAPAIKKRHIPTMFLSNFSPEQAYKNVYERCPSDLDPLLRRLQVVNVTEDIRIPWE